MFAIATLIFIIYLLISFFFAKPLETINRTMMENSSQLTSYLKEAVDGAETIKTSHGESYTKHKTHHLFSEFINSNIKGSMLELTKENLTDMATSIATLVYYGLAP